MIDTDPEPGTVRSHLHCGLGKLSIKDSNTFSNSRPPKQNLETRCQNPDLFLQFYFPWNYYFITCNKSYNSLPSLWATHAGIPSFTQARDSYLTTDSNTTPEFRASSQDYCILAKLLWHLDQHNRIALTAAWPASMETTRMTMV